ncbi:MAG: AsnC family transcriptional regulator [Methanobacteriota archaeon]|nr:MAG: AsnC family transcriptional regulator [Euryarchaeota archaeon]HIK78992.1 Lrp/AsnC family transcriptional regulator [Candidatus Poseidoniales archaeon]
MLRQMFNNFILSKINSERIIMQLDGLDRKLISELIKDGRASQRQLAKLLDVSQGTITNRLSKLHAEGIIRGYSIDIDPEKVGWDMTVMVALRIEKGMMINVQQSIAADSRVIAVYDVTGEYDSMVIARVTGREDLNDLTKNVLSIEGISRSFTHVVLNTVKESGVSLPK